MRERNIPIGVAIGIGAAGILAVLATMPLFVDPYIISVMLTILSYVVMATAWAMFSGTTGYISLATAAFYGIGAYVVAFYGEVLPFPLVILIAAVVGFLIALVVGLSTLRLAGVYFVVFTFGLTELVRQVMIWWEINQTRTLVRHVFLDYWPEDLYYYLLALVVLTFATGFLVQRSRLGLALRAIGQDEAVANHTGINTTVVKVTVFALSAAFMSATGAAMMPRWTYIDPNIAFNPLVSFLVLIMALLGGAGRLHGPALGVIPLAILFEILTAEFPREFSIVLGACFIIIVFFLPQGVLGAIEMLGARARRMAGGRR